MPAAKVSHCRAVHTPHNPPPRRRPLLSLPPTDLRAPPRVPPRPPPRTLVQRLLQEHGEVHLSALGIACSSMVTVAEILKARK